MLSHMKRTRGSLLALFVAALLASPATGGDAKRLTLDLRVVPRIGPPSTDFVFVADLKGGVDGRELYCPTLEWQWDSDDTSVEEGNCPPYEAGVTPVQRHFSITHRFPAETSRDVMLVVRQGDKVLARANVSVRVTWEKKPPTATIRQG